MTSFPCFFGVTRFGVLRGVDSWVDKVFGELESVWGGGFVVRCRRRGSLSRRVEDGRDGGRLVDNHGHACRWTNRRLLRGRWLTK